MPYLSTTEHLALAVRRALVALRDEAAEGVISTAIAVLVLAFVGAGMWVGFNAIMGDTCDAVAEQMDSTIGSQSTAGVSGGTRIDCQ